MSVIVDVIINTDQAEQQLQDLQQQIASDLAQGAARIGTTAGQAATATARAAGKNATEEFLRAFDPDKLRAELESAGLDEQQIEIILETTAAKAETQKLKDTIASAFGEASGFATDALKQITAQAAREVDRAAGKVKSVTEIVDGVRDLKDQLQQVGGASDEAAEGIGQLVLNETVDKFGDLKDIFEKTGVALGGLSQEAVDAAVKVADIAEKGALVGAAFGPMGAAIGLVAGGILGMFNASAEEAAKKSAELKTRIDETAKGFTDIQAQLSGATLSFDELAKVQDDLRIKLSAAYAVVAEQEVAVSEAAQAADRAAQSNVILNNSITDGTERRSFAIASTANLSRATAEQEAATSNLTSAQQALNKAQETAIFLQGQLADSALQTVNNLLQQYEKKKKGDEFAGLSTAELGKKTKELEQSFYDQAKAAEFAAKKSLQSGTDGGIAADAAKTAAEAFQKWQEALGKYEIAQSKASAATAAGSKATKDKTDKDKDALKMAEEATKATEHQAKVEEIVAKIEADRERKIYEYKRGLREQSMKDAAAANELAIKQAEELAKAQADTAKATIDAYKQILQPYADFVGTIFGTFVQGLAEGQSATEAFAQGVRQAVAAALGALAKEFGVKSLGALAEGFAALSNPFTAAAAPGFFKSAALYAAAAAAAGAGSAFVSSAGGGAGGSVPNVGGGAGISSSAGGVGGTGNSLGGSSQQSNGTPGSIVVDLRGAVFPTNDLTGAQQFGEAVARSLAAASAGNQPMARRLIGTRGFVV
jgi:hypothetical protein